LYIKLDNIDLNSNNSILLNKTEEPFTIACDVAYNLAEKYSRLSDIEIGQETNSISINMSSEYYYSLVYELIDNALKFSKKSEKVVLNSSLDNNNFNISIIDQGIGIDKDKVKSIAALNQFNRKKNEQQGLGLGLAIATKIINIHNGNYRIESNESGTKFEIIFPCIKN
jgi:two-component system sensor histidine kinase/response regulator